MPLEIKEKLYLMCSEIVQARIGSIRKSIERSQNSANSETKSTAGDKYDTARAMIQLEVERKSKQLLEAEKLKYGLAQFDARSGGDPVKLGSLITTRETHYYISVSAGKLELEGQTYFAVSPLSPIAQAAMGLQNGDTFILGRKKFEIISLS